MADEDKRKDDILPEEVAQNPGARAAAIHANPEISLEEARNAAAGEGPNAMGSEGYNPDEDKVPANSEPESADLPTAHMPSPDHTRP